MINKKEHTIYYSYLMTTYNNNNTTTNRNKSDHSFTLPLIKIKSLTLMQLQKIKSSIKQDAVIIQLFPIKCR